MNSRKRLMAHDADLQRLCCYMARQERRTGGACVTNGDMEHVTAGDAGGRQSLLRRALSAGLIVPASNGGVGDRYVWQLTMAGHLCAKSAPPEIKAWRLAPKFAAAATRTAKAGAAASEGASEAGAE